MSRLIKIFYIILIFISSFHFKAIAEPTFVQSKSIDTATYYGLTFNNDGTKMYTLRSGGTTDAVIEHTLTTAYDISTATVNNTKVVHVSGGGDSHIPTQVVFNNDGTKMFIVNHFGRRTVDYWSLTTAFDVSTASFDGGFDIRAREKRANSIAFNNDGTRMFIAGVGDTTQVRIHEYSLATPFDLSSGVTHLNIEDLSSFHNHIDGVTFNYDGTKMYTINGAEDLMSQFKLTTPYDVSTLSLEGTYNVSSLTNNAREVVFSNDGSKMFILDDLDNKIHEFNLSCNWSIIDGACDDPADDKEISSSIESQTETAKQIAIQASTPVLNRMYWLRRHRTSDQLSNQNINFNFPNKTIASLAKVFPIAEKTNNTLNKLSDNWSFWSEGSVSFGRTGDTSSSASKDINSNGITIGMDKKISENKLYGYALRFGNDEVDIGSSGTSLDTESFSLSLYGTFPHDEERFTESIIGISTLKTDHVRVGGGNRRTGERDGAQVFGSINYVTKYKKNNFVIDPNIRIDLSYTELSKYREKGVAALVYNKQTVETGMVSTGFTISDILDFDTFTFKSYGGLELGLDFSPSSDATYRYLSETTEYTKAIDQDSKNLRANIGFDLINENGLSIMTIYERNQSDNSHSDTLYFGLGYVPSDDIEYAMNLDNNKAYLSYNRNLKGFDIRVNSNYDLMSSIPDYGATIELVSTF
ncbi:autotransporter outer membrane beta-barrel domain-containing protein [Candidatus Pelagibacter communis]|uniref:autotransporter outer membrane beta-barrel domain-containing protein n=1 Tax=Pelagibacter ubique TaxID=198252 RepID=UPI0015CF731C|nr:autotransporter outer membrane beta-barrel domain-containing protein [Candidatus Pelagibacter ubique]